jgi:hypothetical protein
MPFGGKNMEKGEGKIRKCARKRKMLKRKKYEEILKIL